MSVKITLEREHKCAALKNIDCVFIGSANWGQRWLWYHVENLNTLKEKTTCHEIKFCPYCGQELEG